jgi:TonB family protein
MHRIIFNLFVAVLTFALGIVASMFLNSFTSPPMEKASSRVVLAQKAPAPEIISETISTRCACSQSTDETITATEGAESSAPIRGGILNDKAISLPKPSYPAIARAARASGNVAVEVLIDERGCVRSARALGGHPLLQAAAVEAARQACFAPTRLLGKPKRLEGTLSYNFTLQ